MIHLYTSCCLVAKLSPTLLSPVDCSPPNSPVPEILQARREEWVAISFSRGSSRPRDRICISCIGRGILYTEPPGKPSVTHMYINIYIFWFFFFISYFKTLSIDVCALQQILVVYFMCGSMSVLTPNSWFIPPLRPHFSSVTIRCFLCLWLKPGEHRDCCLSVYSCPSVGKLLVASTFLYFVIFPSVIPDAPQFLKRFFFVDHF